MATRQRRHRQAHREAGRELEGERRHLARLKKHKAERDATAHVDEYACHEGNYAMANILAGARADEGTPQR